MSLVLSVADNYLQGDFTSVPNGTTAAGYLTPLQGFTVNGPKDTGPKPGAAPSANSTPSSQPSSGTDSSTDPAPAPAPADPESPTDGGGNGPKLPNVPKLPPVTIPALPETNVQPVDDVLTLAQALVQCTLDGLIDNPLSSVDKFDQCVDDYTKK